jgi:hypothetical protein
MAAVWHGDAPADDGPILERSEAHQRSRHHRLRPQRPTLVDESGTAVSQSDAQIGGPHALL